MNGKIWADGSMAVFTNTVDNGIDNSSKVEKRIFSPKCIANDDQISIYSTSESS